MRNINLVQWLLVVSLVLMTFSGCDDINIVEPCFVTESSFDYDITVLNREALKQDQFWVKFSLPEDSHVSISILDGSGFIVRMLVDGYFAPGLHKVEWDLKDKNGKEVEDGLYCLAFETPTYSRVMFFKIKS
ncbi:MAG: FlgD immunoglobulin-like domain containing protein [Candidatus Hatepunaea meridiana]|nr:FlgD immunoglobulin-like domain containing protein [Candidatus Hatepunaea meridiana]